MLNQMVVYVVAVCWLGCLITQESPAQNVESKSYLITGGVGIGITSKEGRIYVGGILPKSPADKSGLLGESAQIVSVEVGGKKNPLDGLTIGEAAGLIRGPVGTKVILSVIPKTDAAAIKVTLTREPLAVRTPDETYKTFIGKAMPGLKLNSLDGKQTSQIADYRGKVVVLDFWASWCPTCYPPVTKMQAIAEQNPSWKGKVELIAVTVDSDVPNAVRVIDKQKWTNTLHRTVDVEKLNSIGISVVPVVVIIARDGTIANMASAHAVDIEKEVTALLEK